MTNCPHHLATLGISWTRVGARRYKVQSSIGHFEKMQGRIQHPNGGKGSCDRKVPTIKNHINLRIDVETASHMRHTKTIIESGAGTIHRVRSDEGLTLETSAFRISVRWPIYHDQIFVYYFPTDAAPQFLWKLPPSFIC